MSRASRRAARTLERRVAAMPKNPKRAKGYRKPGSLNPHKSYPAPR